MCVRVLRQLKCRCVRVAASVKRVKGCPTCTSATWRDQRAPFFVLRISIAVVGPAGRWVPERGGGSDAGGRRAGARAATAGRRPWPTLTCDADRYGDACRDCHVCAVHERKRPSRMREWQWAETVNRTEKGGLLARAFRQDATFRQDETGQTRATGTGYGDIGSYRIHIGVTIRDPGPGRCAGRFHHTTRARAGGGVRGRLTALYCCSTAASCTGK